jgi:armadillo repeat-containing protein 1
VLFLDNEDPRVLVTALEALNFLAKHSSNHQAMKNELGMLISLQTIMKNCQGNSKAVELATSVHNKLTTTRSDSSRHVMGSVSRKVQIIILQIKGLVDEGCRQMLEEVLVTVPGVISFTFNMARKRCTVRNPASLPVWPTSTGIYQLTLLSDSSKA